MTTAYSSPLSPHNLFWTTCLLLPALLCSLVAPGCGPKAPDPESIDTTSGSSAGPATSVGDTGTPATTGVAPTSTTTLGPCVTAACTTDASSSSTGCTFLGCDSDTGTCQGPTEGCPCDVVGQDCPDGQTCAPVIPDDGASWSETRCVPVTGDGQPGDACVSKSVADGLDDCAKGSMCWDVDDQGHGKCVEQCSGSSRAPFCANMSPCTIAANAALALCLPACSPLLQDCNEGNACYPIQGSFMCEPDASGDGGQANAPCEFINVCEAGLMCAEEAFVGAGCPQGSIGCCSPFCDLSDPAACPNPDQQCVAFFDPMNVPDWPSDAADIGVCGLPS